MYFENTEISNMGMDIDLSKFMAHRKRGGEDKEPLLNHLENTKKYFDFIISEKNLDKVFQRIEDSIMEGSPDENRELYREMILNAVYYHDLGKISRAFQKYKMGCEDEDFKELAETNHSIFSAAVFSNYYIKRISEVDSEEEKARLYTILGLLNYCISAHHSSSGKVFESIYNSFKKMDSWNENVNFCDILSLTGMDDISFKEGRCFLERDTQYPYSIKTFLYKLIDEKSDKHLDVDEKGIDYIIFLRFIYGLMVQSDFYSTTDYMSGPVEDLGKIGDDLESWIGPYRENNVYKGIQKYREFKNGNIPDSPFPQNDINKLRSDIFIEAEENLEKNFDRSSIFQLEAPTGSGKTNTSINLALKCLEMDKSLNKIFYVFPFNNLVEQTMDTFERIYEGNDYILNRISVVNSITEPKFRSNNKADGGEKKNDSDEDYSDEECSNEKYCLDYNQILLDREFLHYPMTITTNIALFKILFGAEKEDFFPLSLLANSVVIIDEIQSYKNVIWLHIIKFLNRYSKLLNIKIIIMSATLPDFNVLLYNKDRESESIEGTNISNLIECSKKYYENELFKNRVKLDYSLIDTKNDILNSTEVEGLAKDLKYGPYIDAIHSKLNSVTKDNNKNVLIEFINKKQALKFFKDCLVFKDEGEMYSDKKIYIMTGDNNKVDREKIIREIKSNTEGNIILVATQCIEAGVDIDMDMGFKDISLLDLDEQFLGRINRSSKKENATVYFFDLTEAGEIYKNDCRNNNKIILKNDKARNMLEQKDFGKFYKRVNREFQKKIVQNINDEEIYSMSNFRRYVRSLDLEKISKVMTLINQKDRNAIFLSRDIKTRNKLGEEITIDGDEIWEEYKQMVGARNKMDYSEWKIKLISVMAKVNLFTYEVNFLTKSYNDSIGNIHYYSKESSADLFETITMEDGEELYILDRGKYSSTSDYEYL